LSYDSRKFYIFILQIVGGQKYRIEITNFFPGIYIVRLNLRELIISKLIIKN